MENNFQHYLYHMMQYLHEKNQKDENTNHQVQLETVEAVFRLVLAGARYISGTDEPQSDSYQECEDQD